MIIKDGKTFELSTPEEMLAYQVGMKDQFNDCNKTMVTNETAETYYNLGVIKGMIISTVVYVIATVGTVGICWICSNKTKIKAWFEKLYKKIKKH